ncbi:hypothetical protein H6775_02120 [Candidatus Nomurabacteria bacterium]|nr:hypothetical protein [Candidatus Nomurabacteria bacterium]
MMDRETGGLWASGRNLPDLSGEEKPWPWWKTIAIVLSILFGIVLIVILVAI